MSMLLFGRILALCWIAISVWVGSVNALLSFIAFAFPESSSERPVSPWFTLTTAFALYLSAVAAATWAFDSGAHVVQNLALAALSFGMFSVVFVVAWTLVKRLQIPP